MTMMMTIVVLERLVDGQIFASTQYLFQHPFISRCTT